MPRPSPACSCSLLFQCMDSIRVSILVHAFALCAVLPRAHKVVTPSVHALKTMTCLTSDSVHFLSQVPCRAIQYFCFFAFQRHWQEFTPSHTRPLLANGLWPRVCNRRNIWNFPAAAPANTPLTRHHGMRVIESTDCHNLLLLLQHLILMRVCSHS